MYVNSFLSVNCRILILLNDSARASISPDSHLLAISDLAHGFTVHDYRSGAFIRRFVHEVGRRFPVPVLFIHQGHAIVGGSTVGHVNIWDVEDGNRLAELNVPST